ncbi:hypothetical protein DAMA08_053890 [Martiniozyma asiatica (nom. inval.)]|nr:hypothetical protein DAMA08_053890 [Martiniozyma asiatica]
MTMTTGINAGDLSLNISLQDKINELESQLLVKDARIRQLERELELKGNSPLELKSNPSNSNNKDVKLANALLLKERLKRQFHLSISGMQEAVRRVTGWSVTIAQPGKYILRHIENGQEKRVQCGA